MKHKGLVIADIHSVVIDLPSYQKEMEYLIHQLYIIEDLDYMVICGDYFDHKMYLNDIKAQMSIRYLKEIVRTCKNRKIKLRIVYGTKSHEEDQYKILAEEESDYYKLIETVQSEALFDDLFVLYLPEEFISNKQEYYKEHLFQGVQYDYIFGHGVIRDVMTKAANHVEASSKFKKVPTFTYAELSESCIGEVYFGHYHIRTNLNDKVFYIGSYDRFIFDDGDDGSEKGFYLIEKKKKEYSHVFQMNPYAKKFTTITFNNTHPIFQKTDQVVSMIGEIRDSLQENGMDKIRLVFELPEQMDSEVFLSTIHSLTDSDKRIKISVNKKEEKQKKEQEKKFEEQLDKKYQFVADESLLLEVVVSSFIQVEYGEHVEEEVIRELLEKN